MKGQKMKFMALQLSDVRRDLETIRSLILHARKRGAQMVDAVSDLIRFQIELCFEIHDEERTKQYIRSEVVSLLHGVGTGKIATITNEYLLRRYLRLTRNLLALGIIRKNRNIYFSSLAPEGSRHEEDSVERFLHSLLENPESFRIQEEEEEEENFCCREKKRGRRGGPQARTIKKEKDLLAVSEFRPGCLAQGPGASTLQQRTLF